MRRTHIALACMFVAAWMITPLARAKVPVMLSTDIGNEIDDQWAIRLYDGQSGFRCARGDFRTCAQYSRPCRVSQLSAAAR